MPLLAGREAEGRGNVQNASAACQADDVADDRASAWAGCRQNSVSARRSVIRSEAGLGTRGTSGTE